jgi:ribosomal-protein-alanine N-acetyltransferase
MIVDIITNKNEMPEYTSIPEISAFLFKEMKPYHDTLPDIIRGVEDALNGKPAAGGFILCASNNGLLIGALVMLRTGMKGYIPENLLLFLGVKENERSHGIGRALIDKALSLCSGSIKLHVEHDNPARRLYEKTGFSSKYLDMRISLPERRP